MSRFFILILSFFIINPISAQYLVAPSSVKWYNIERALELNKKNPKPLLIDVYTEGSSWCRYMMKTTFANKGIASYINNHFYPIRFDAETLDTVEFNGKKYFNRQIGHRPTHDLATYLLDNKLSYPSIVYFDIDGEKMVVSGFKEAKDIEPILVYQVEDLSDNVSLAEFTANFMYTYPEAFEKDHSIFKIPKELKPDTLGRPNWVNPESVTIKSKKRRKPTVVFFYTDWCINCEVMEKTTFGNRDISDLLNEYFNVVKLNAASQEKIMFLGRWYKGAKKNSPHEFVRALLKQDLQFPAVVFFDEQGKQVSKNIGYMNVQSLDFILHYFIDKKHKTISYNEYLKGEKAAGLTKTKNSVN